MGPHSSTVLDRACACAQVSKLWEGLGDGYGEVPGMFFFGLGQHF